MRFVRVAAAATSLSLVGSLSLLGSAGAQAPPGFGTSEASTNVLNVQLGTGGDLLGLVLLGDSARSTIDSAVTSVPEAYSLLSALRVSSKAVPALNVSIPTAPYEARQPGGKASDSAQGVNLGSALPAGVASGVLSLAKLTAAASPGLARSTMDGSVGSLSSIGGLVAIKDVSSALATSAAQADAGGTRAVRVGGIDALPLGDLLNGLGIPLSGLTLPQVSQLLGALQATVPNVGDAAALQALVGGLQSQIATLAAQVASASGLPAGSTVSGIVGSVPGLTGLIPSTTVTDITNIADAVPQAQALLDELESTLAEVLSDTLETLDGLSLLKVGASEVGVVTKAADTVANSTADITAKLGSVSVGGLTLPGVDLAAAATTVNALVGTVNDTLQGALGAISPDLAGLVSVSVLDHVKSVTSSGGYVRSRAGITALSASIKPPANLAALVSGIAGQAGSLGSIISGVGGSVPVLGSSMGDLNGTLGTGVRALSGGATVKMVEVLAASDHAALAAPGTATTPPGGTLPRTGRDDLPMAALGALLIAFGLGLRHWLRMPLRRAS